MSDATGDFPLIESLSGGIEAMKAVERLAPLGHVVFFDSALRHDSLGRYSFVTADPFDWIELRAGAQHPFDAIRGKLEKLNSTLRSDLPPFQGGLAGLFGYDLNRSLERIATPRCDEFRLPALAAGFYDVVVAFDHILDKAWIISQGLPETDRSRRMKRATARLAEFRQQLLGSDNGRAETKHQTSHAVKADALAPQFGTRYSGVTSCFSETSYKSTVERAIEYIHAGDVFQVNLAQRLLHPARESPIDLYHRLRSCNPAPFASYFDLGNHQICSASPERLLSIRDGTVEARPIKGTRARISRPEADLYAAADLRASAKDRAENTMIVDLLRNDMSKVCRAESVRVTQLCGLEQYAYVQHLVSVVEGKLADEHSAIDAMEAAFPGGSITGAPKVRAMEIIAELEPVARGAYCGSLGYIGFDGTCDASILIRTMTDSGSWLQMPVGGGIVADSNPIQEFEETWHKAAGMLRAIHPA